MKWIKSSLLVLVVLGSATAGTAWADRGHFGGYRGGFHGGYHGGARVGLGIYVNPFPLFYGPSYYGPAYYPYPYYNEVVVAPAPTTVYVEPATISPAPNYNSVQPGQSSDWYYCHNPDGFYPSVKTCPSGWQRVPPQAPADR